jgi:phage terminase small subunit
MLKHPPTWLAGRALEFWRRFAHGLAKDGWLTATDVPNFAVLCGLVAVMEGAWDVFRESGQGHALALIATKECRAWLAKFRMSYDAPAWQQSPGS